MDNISNYELLELFDTYIYSAAEYFMWYLSVFFAFLATVYFVGKQLSEKLIGVMIALYTAFTVLPAVGSYVSTDMCSAIAAEIFNRGSQMPAIAETSLWIYTGTIGGLFKYLVSGLQVLTYITGLIFLFEIRKKQSSSENEAA